MVSLVGLGGPQHRRGFGSCGSFSKVRFAFEKVSGAFSWGRGPSGYVQGLDREITPIMPLLGFSRDSTSISNATNHFGEKRLSPRRGRHGLSFLFRLSEPRFAKIPPLCCPAPVRFIPDPRMPSGQSGCCPILKSLTAFRSLVPTILPNLATLLRAYSLEKFPIIPTNLCVKAVEKFNLSNDAMRH
jgi:hypothetical protein